MTTDSWRPLSRRADESLVADDLVEGVPRYLQTPLRKWVSKVFDGAAADVDPWGPKDDTLEREVTLRLGIPIPRYADGEQLLDVIDAALWFFSAKTPVSWGDRREYLAAELQQILDASRSAWRVNAGSSGLQRRLDEAVTAVADETEAKVGGSAAEHLRAARAEAYGRHPDPDAAYRESVLAVEAVACPLVLPNADNTRTLGKVIAHLGQAPYKWELAITDKDALPASVATLVAMLKLLWEGQSRHAGSSNSRRQTQAEAEAAVHLAVLLVRWLDTGVLRRANGEAGI